MSLVLNVLEVFILMSAAASVMVICAAVIASRENQSEEVAESANAYGGRPMSIRKKI